MQCAQWKKTRRFIGVLSELETQVEHRLSLFLLTKPGTSFLVTRSFFKTWMTAVLIFQEQNSTMEKVWLQTWWFDEVSSLTPRSVLARVVLVRTIFNNHHPSGVNRGVIESPEFPIAKICISALDSLDWKRQDIFSGWAFFFGKCTLQRTKKSTKDILYLSGKSQKQVVICLASKYLWTERNWKSAPETSLQYMALHLQYSLDIFFKGLQKMHQQYQSSMSL